jgi:hypothetical protein
MITYKLTTCFEPNWTAIQTAAFGDAQPDATMTAGFYAEFSFNDESTPINDLGPLVLVQSVIS